MLTLRRVESSLDELEHFLVGIAAKIAPWAADLPVAYLAARNIIDVLQWHPAIGWIAAAAVEALGLACTATALEFADYNATKRKTDPPAPTSLAWAMVGVYFGSSLVLSLLATFTRLELFAVLVWPVISSVGTLVHAMRKDHARRLAANDAARERERNERRERKLERERVQHEQERSEREPEQAQNVHELSEREQQLVQFYADHPGASYSEAAQACERSKTWVANSVNGLLRAGTLRKNGHGVQVA